MVLQSRPETTAPRKRHRSQSRSPLSFGPSPASSTLTSTASLRLRQTHWVPSILPLAKPSPTMTSTSSRPSASFATSRTTESSFGMSTLASTTLGTTIGIQEARA
eukprot:3250303-Pyramimonas_sp.AAC.1